jgi:phosphatidylserine decarboxylase
VIRTAPEGRWFIAAAWLIAALLAGLGWWIALVLWLPIAIWVVAFFRDPIPVGERGELLILAPADGKVVDVRTVDEPTFFHGPAQRISIFMNVFDCHVNRYPVAGTVVYRHYNPGKFLHAAEEKASLDNEQATVGLETPRGLVMIRQIAGLIARRIVTDHPIGTQVEQAQRLGIIRFGSRVDLFLPLSAQILVKPGDRTRVAVTAVARWA